MPKLNAEMLHRITQRGVVEIIVEAEFVRLLEAGKPLRLKMGFDPSRPDLHLGHVVGLRKLRQLQDLGHQVILIVGDWTARIGDPSGQSDTRTMLNADEVMVNAETYMRQFFKVIDPQRTQAVYQSEWFGDFTLSSVIDLTSRFTVNQFLHRDDFARRYESGQPVAITELLYPLLQAYDSVAIQADVEFGGTDQKFNLLVGRELQGKMGHRPQQCFIMPLLVGTDGVRKMSKSLDNYIALEDPPNEMFGKVMSLPDELLPTYFELLTDAPADELAEVRQAVESGGPGAMAMKKRLAGEMVAQFHSADDARRAEEDFQRVVQRGQAPDDVPEFVVTAATDGVKTVSDSIVTVDLKRFLPAVGLATSSSEARRLLTQGAVMIGVQPVSQDSLTEIQYGALLKSGPRRYVRIVKG
jgi:tyrosyl-tRNA synthetase